MATSVSGSQVHNSPLNTSKSKFQYSFPKDTRFKSMSSLQGSDIFYDLPSTKMSRSSAIGYGQKYDFTKNSPKTPAPGTYSQKQMTIEAHEKNGWSFGLSRENMTKTSGPLGQLNEFSPGPGTYRSLSTLGSQSYSLRQKTSPPDSKNTNLQSPGPGTYQQLPAISGNGKYTLSKYKSYGSTQFNPKNSSRFGSVCRNVVPGPGTYQQPASITDDGKYFVSRYKSSSSRTFSHQQRVIELSVNPKSPGPGSYRLPSDFGYYEAKPNAAK